MKRFTFKKGAALTLAVTYAVTTVASCGPDGVFRDQSQDARTIALRLSSPPAMPTDSILATEKDPDGYANDVVRGEASVGVDGAALFRIPLWVPRGRAGIEPQLALTYSSRNSSGDLGRGWRLAGLSQITRCARTYAQDGYPEAVAFDPSARFCLDGQRLVAKTGLYGADGTEYRTEIDSHARVFSYGGAGYGPTSFKVYFPDGRIATYGGQNASSVQGYRRELSTDGYPTLSSVLDTFAWALAKVEDRAGNFLTVTYHSDPSSTETGTVHYPLEIRYTGSTARSESGNRVVEFEWEQGPEVRTGFVAGMAFRRGHRLKAIEMHGPRGPTGSLALLRRYTLTYDEDSATRTSLLTQVDECDGGGVCLKPLTFQWTSPPTYTHQSLFPINATAEEIAPAGDFNGDGSPDFLIFNTQSRAWQIRTGPHWNEVTPTGFLATEGVPSQFTVRDLNNDGLSDVALIWKNGGRRYFEIYLARPGYVFEQVYYRDNDGVSYTFSDLDGDAYQDLAIITTWYNDSGEHRSLRIALGGLSGFTDIPQGMGGTSVFFSGDPFGRARGSLLLLGSDENYTVAWMSETGALAYRRLLRNGGQRRPYWVDLNGDGLKDELGVPEAGGNPSAWLSSGGGMLDFSFPSLDPSAHIGPSETARVHTADLNTDGLEDLLLMDRFGGRQSPVVLEWTPTGFATRTLPFVLPAAGSPEEKTSQVVDLNSDSLPDVVQGLNGYLRGYVSSGERPLLLKRALDGRGQGVTFTYGSIGGTQGLHQPSTEETFPLVAVKSGHVVVSSLSATNAAHPPRAETYTYSGGVRDLRRGGVMFRSQTITGEPNRVTIRDVDVQFPRAGTVSSERLEVQLHDRTHISETASQVTIAETAEVDGATRYHVQRQDRSTRTGQVLSGTISDQTLSLRTSAVLFDTNGCAYSDSTTYLDGSTREIARQFDSRDQLFCLPSFVEETSTTESGSTETRQVAATFDARGLLETTTIEPNGGPPLKLVTTLARDVDGLVETTTHTDSSGTTRTSSVTYDAFGKAFVASRTNAVGHVAYTAYEAGLGVPVAAVAPNGVETRWRYDGFGRVRSVDVITPPELGTDPGPEKTWSYGYEGVKESITGGVSMTTLNDLLGRPERLLISGYGGAIIEATTGYDQFGRVIATGAPMNHLAPTAKTTVAYDDLGRITGRTLPNGAVTTVEYDGLVTVEYGELGTRSKAITNSLGQVVETANGLNTPSGAFSHYVGMSFEYGPFGALKAMVDPLGNRTSLTYDVLGRRTSITTPDTGTTTTTFNAFGEIASVTDANGTTATYEYDAIGRVTTISNSLDGVTTYEWDTNGIGQLAWSTSADGITTSYTYDTLGRLTHTAWSNIPGVSNTYILEVSKYDALGRVEEVKYPSDPGVPEFALKYTYDELGFLKSVENRTSGVKYWIAEGRNSAFALTQERLGNGIVTTRTYDELGQLRGLSSTGPRGTVQQQAFEYDRVGNLVTRNDLVAKTTEEFNYDSLDRLTNWKVFQNCTSVATALSYDDLGNMLSRTTSTGDSITFSPGGTDASGKPFGPHQLRESTYGAYSYDPAGNQTSAPGRTVAFTSFLLPQRITETASGRVTEFKYDSDNKRILKRNSAGEETLYLGDVYERRVRSGSVSHHFLVYAEGRPVAQSSWTQQLNGTYEEALVYLSNSKPGSVDIVTNNAGSVVESLKYDPFGARVDPSSLGGTDPTPTSGVTRGFTGHEHDDDLGLINMGGRLYDPRANRFTSADPVIGEPASVQSHNPYSYVLNNPLRWTDPSGFIYSADPMTVYLDGNRISGLGGWGASIISAADNPFSRFGSSYRSSVVGVGGYYGTMVTYATHDPKVDPATASSGVATVPLLDTWVSEASQYVLGVPLSVPVGASVRREASPSFLSPDWVYENARWFVDADLTPIANGVGGWADTVSFGIGGLISEAIYGAQTFDETSAEYNIGRYVGVATQLVAGAFVVRNGPPRFINPQKQAGHVPGTPQHANRVKSGKMTSAFFSGRQANSATFRAWAKGTHLNASGNLRLLEFNRPIGIGPRGGGFQTQVRVSMDGSGTIHGTPWGPVYEGPLLP